MNGEAKDFLSWVIQCNHPEILSPDVVCDWLEARLPNPWMMKHNGKSKPILPS